MDRCEYVVNNLAGESDGLAQENRTTPNETLHSRFRNAIPRNGHLSLQTTMPNFKSAVVHHNGAAFAHICFCCKAKTCLMLIVVPFHAHLYVAY